MRWLEHRFGAVLPPLNAGQIYTTLARLQRDGLVEDAAQRALPGRRLASIDWHDVRSSLTDQTRTNTNTLLALLAVGFTIAAVIGGRILAQRRQIGLLKAIGLTPRGVTALLVGEYLAIGVVAGSRAWRSARRSRRCSCTRWRTSSPRPRRAPCAPGRSSARWSCCSPRSRCSR